MVIISEVMFAIVFADRHLCCGILCMWCFTCNIAGIHVNVQACVCMRT